MRRIRLQLVLPVMLLMTGATAAQTPPAMDANRWNLDTATPSKPETGTAPPSTLNLRVYRDFNGRKPGDSQNPYAVDVSAVMTRCTDSSLIVTALVIGGQLTPLDNHCPNTSQ